LAAADAPVLSPEKTPDRLTDDNAMQGTEAATDKLSTSSTVNEDISARVSPVRL
jgi:hypothetical protein